MLCVALALGLLGALLWAPGASADTSVCPSGEGAGQCAGARGLALDRETGRLHVGEEGNVGGNARVSVFAEDGSFLFAFGWGVDTGAEELQSCTAASGCQAGVPGSGAGQLPNREFTIAVDGDSHAIYVGERSNRRVQKFDEDGEFVWMIGKGVNQGPLNPGDLCTAQHIEEGDTCGAGTNSEEEGGFFSAASSGIYPGVGPEGDLYVLDSLPGEPETKHRLQRFDEEGALLAPQCVLFEGGAAAGLAVEAGGDFWVSNRFEGRGIRKYEGDEECTPLLGPIGADVEQRTNGLALDEAGRLFAGQGEQGALGGSYAIVTAHNPAGEIVRRFAYDRIPGAVDGIAAREGGEGGVFVSVDAGVVRLESAAAPPDLPPPGPIVAPSSVEAPSPSSAKALVVAEVNPEGKATDYRFEYVTEAEYDKDLEEGGDGFGGPTVQETEEATIEPEPGEEFKLHAVEALLGCEEATLEKIENGECLAPETPYRFRAIATNADGGGEGTVEGEPFETKSAPELGDTYATSVGTDTARLAADVNPTGSLATGFFEYVGEAAYQKDIEEGGDGFAAAVKAPDVDSGEAELDFGAGEEFVSRSVAVGPLDPGASYRYRIFADTPLGDPEIGSPRLLRTFSVPAPDASCANASLRIGPAAFLPDCRAYELVSPLDKAGGDILVLENSLQEPVVIEQSSDSGERLAYGTWRAFDDAPSAPYTSQYIADRVPDADGAWDPEEGWQSHSIGVPRHRPFFNPAGQLFPEYQALSPDLCEGWLKTFADVDPLPHPPGYVPGYSNLLRRADGLCGAEGYEALAPLEAPPSVPPENFLSLPSRGLVGLAADGAHAIFIANDNLVEGLPPQPASCVEGGIGCRNRLYESHRTPAGPDLRDVCISPAGTPLPGACKAGSDAPNEGITPKTGAISADGERIFFSDANAGAGKLYVRIGGEETLEVSRAAEEAAGTAASFFWAAAADGSAAIFTTGGRLHAFDVDAETTSPPLAEGVIGVMGIGEDASRVYFASTQALPESGPNSEGAEAIEGKPNLYLYEAGEGGGGASYRFVATLAGADVTAAVSSEESSKRTARVAPDGAHAAFASVAGPASEAAEGVPAPTGYDNKGAASGAATKEIYLYDAEAGELVCASCNPTGARPAGAASIPSFLTPLHGARALAPDGRRLYFQSADRLAARDANGAVDVYQWEAEGAGGCGAGDAGFAEEAGGCIELVSSGQSRHDSRFVEADPSGKNVFFATAESLLPQDFGLVDIYDARAGGGLPVPPPPPSGCEGEACQSPPPAPEDPTPASSAFKGPGNLSQTGPSRCARVARKAKNRSRRARRARRAARRMARRRAARRARAGSRKARRLAKGARRLSAKAKRCRARERKANRGRAR